MTALELREKARLNLLAADNSSEFGKAAQAYIDTYDIGRYSLTSCSILNITHFAAHGRLYKGFGRANFSRDGGHNQFLTLVGTQPYIVYTDSHFRTTIRYKKHAWPDFALEYSPEFFGEVIGSRTSINVFRKSPLFRLYLPNVIRNTPAILDTDPLSSEVNNVRYISETIVPVSVLPSVQNLIAECYSQLYEYVSEIAGTDIYMTARDNKYRLWQWRNYGFYSLFLASDTFKFFLGDDYLARDFMIVQDNVEITTSTGRTVSQKTYKFLFR